MERGWRLEQIFGILKELESHLVNGRAKIKRHVNKLIYLRLWMGVLD